MKKKSLLLLIPFAAAAAVALGSCGKDPGPQCDQASVLLDYQMITVEIGETKQLTASSNIESCTLEVNWRSDDESIASVDQNGVVTGHKNGETTIYANDVPCIVTVGTGHADVHVESIDLESPSSKSPKMCVGDELEISVSISPENATNKLLDITSDNEEVAKINESGYIEAVGEGKAVISIVSQDNPEAKIEIHVSVSVPDAPVPEATANGFALLKSGEVQSGEAVVLSGIDGNKFLTMGTYEEGKNNIPAVESSVNSDGKLVLNSKAGVYIALKNEDGSFSFKDTNNKYLSAAGTTKNNWLKVVDEIDETAKFSFSVTDGAVTLVCTSENVVSNTIALNSANTSGPIFSCYKPTSASGYAKINLYHGVAETKVSGVAFEQEKYEVMVDYSITARAAVAPITASDKAITYSLEDLNPAGCATVETVNNEAVIHGIAEGVGKLVATTHEGGFTSKVTLEVKPKGSIVIPVTGINLAAKSGTVTVGETKQINASVLPEDATSKAICFESLTPDLASVDSNGLITSIAPGTAKIKVFAKDYPEVSEQFTLTIKEATVSYPAQTSQGRALIENGTLTDGASINFVAGNEGQLFTAKGALEGTNKFLAVVDCEVSNEKLVLGDGAGTFTVVKNKDGSFSFKTAAGKYLAANKGGNQLLEVSEIDQTAKFNVNIINGVASIVCTDPENTGHNTLMYNAGSPRFACYSSTFSGVAPRIYSMDPEPVDAEGVELNISEKVIAINETFELEASVLPSWAKDKSVTWTTESKGFVSCENGLVKGLKAGSEIVTVTDVMGHTATCTFTVVSEIKHPEKIELSAESLSLNVDDVYDTLSATVSPADAYNKNFTWSSDDESVVKVDENGKLECVGAGTANITVTTEDGGKTDSCSVSVAAASDGVVHAYEAAMAMDPGTGASELSYTISGRIMFMPGNNLIVQDGDHAIIVYKNGSSTKEMEVGKKVTLRCQVQNYNGAAETVQVANSIITVSDDEVSVNKAVIDTSEKMDTSAMPLYADFKNLVLKSKPNVVKGSNSSITVAFEDDLEKEYTLFVKSDEYNEDMANVLNELNVDSKVEIQDAYISGHTSGRQICAGISSVAIDHSEYAPESVVVKNGENAITSLNMVTGGNANLTASVLPAKAPQDVVWETKNNDGVISVVNGAVGALKAGTATIVVSSADKTQSTEILVTVTDEEVIATSVTLDEEAVDLLVGGTKQLTATVLPEGTTDKSIEWSVIEGNDVVSVNNGLVTALAEGEATVQAKNVKSGFTDTCTFTVSKKVIDVDKVDSVTLTAAEDSLNLGSYGSGSNEFYQWTDLAKNSGNIQGNLSTGTNPKDSELHNKFEFSRPIKYVKITVGAKSGDTTTLEMRFGDTEKPEGNAIAMGAETMYDLTTPGNSFVLKPDVAAKYFSLKNTKGATYISSIEIGFVDYNVPIENITLNKDEVSLAVEETFTIEAALTPSDTTHTTLTYTSDHPEIADVTSDGIVIAKAVGTATITVATDDPDIYATCEVTVVAAKVPVTKVELSDHETEILQGGCTTLTATVSPDDATNQDVYWYVEEGKEDIISVDEYGCVSGLKPGTAKVIVKAADNLEIYDECEVTVEERFINVDDVDEYTIDKTSLGVGSEYADGSNEYFEWTKLTTNGNSVQGSADSKYKSELHNVYAFSKEITYIVVEVEKTAGVNATAEVRFGDSVMPTGNAVAIGKDTAYPLDTAGKFVIMVPDGCDFFSLKPTNNAMYFKSITFGFGDYVEHVTDLSLDIAEKTMQVSDTYTLTPTLSPDNATNKEVTYVSDHPEFASVDATTGEITAVAPGTATITATTTDGGKTATCEITVVEKIIAVTDVSLDKDTLALVEGEDSTLVATVTPDNASNSGVTWSSSDETVATVDENGKVTAVGVGQATITAAAEENDSIKDECVVTVTEAPRYSLPYTGSFAFSEGSPVFPEGNWTGTGVAYYSNAYSFQDAGQYVQATKLFPETSVVTVDVTAMVNSESDDSGRLTVYALNDAGEVVDSEEIAPANAKVGGIDAGKTFALENIKSATLTGEHITGIKIAYTTKSGKLFLFDVKISDTSKVASVELNEHELEMIVGGTDTLVATVLPETALNKDVVFSSNNTEAVTVDAASGAIEAVGVGKATITVTTSEGSFTDTCEINVSESKVAVTGVEFAKDSIALAAGDKETVDVTVSPADAFDKSVSYSSDNTSIATVDENGEITAVAPGTATITVTTTDGSFTDTCVVTVLTKATITNANDFPGGSYDKNNYARYAADGSGLLFETYQVNKNSGTIQFQKNAGKLWNISPISGLSEIRFSVSAGSVTVYAGDELKTTDNELTPVDNVYTVPSGCSYFYIVGSKDAATNLSDIEIVCDEIPEYVIPVESVSLDKTTLDLTPTSEPVTLVPEINPSSVLNKEVIWSIKADSDDCITLQNGVVTPTAIGTATVVCTSAADTTKYAECVVTVSATEKKIDVDELDVYELTKDSLGLTSSYADSKSGADITFTQLGWYSSSIQGSKDKGSSITNAYAFSRAIKYIKFNVAVDKPSSKATLYFGSEAAPNEGGINLGSGTDYGFVAGKSIVIKAPADSTYFKLAYTNGAINFTSIEIGFIDYVAPAVESVVLDSTLALNVGEDVELIPVLTPAEAEGKEIVWSSDNTAVATVTDGVVHGVSAGTANIKVVIDGKEATCAVTVSDVDPDAPVTVASVDLTKSLSDTNVKTTNYSSKTGYYQDGGTADSSICTLTYKSATALWEETPESITFNAKIGGGSAKDPMTYPVEVVLLDASGNEIAGTKVTITQKVTTASGDSYSITIPNVEVAYGFKVTHMKESSWNARYYSYDLVIKPASAE